MLSGWLSKTTTSRDAGGRRRHRRRSGISVTWWKSPLPMNAQPQSTGNTPSRWASSALNARRVQPKRMASCHEPSGMRRSPSATGRTEPSKSRITGGDGRKDSRGSCMIRILISRLRAHGLCVGLKPMPEHVQDAAQDRVAHPDQMPGEREPRPKRRL